MFQIAKRPITAINLTKIGNCRICLAELDDGFKPVAFRALPTINRMQFHTRYEERPQPSYYLFKRKKVPPLAQPKESPYIVGPYLKPDYLPTEYIIDPINPKDADDFDHLIYEPIEVQPNQTRRVRLLLIQDVEGLGVAGQVVDAPFRHGASKLIAMRKAEYFNEFTQKWYKFGPKTMASASTALSPRTVRMLQSREYDLPIAKGVSVQPWHISLALRLSGCICPIDAIDKDSIKEDYPQVSCTIRINNHERVEVKFVYAKKSDDED